MEQMSSIEADSLSGCQISYFLWTSKVHYNVQKIPPCVYVCVYTCTKYFPVFLHNFTALSFTLLFIICFILQRIF
jgi:hypothetical protein